MIPQTYQEWHHCIVDECRIELTEEFILQRLDIMKNKAHQETRRMISLYGKMHLEKLITWFTAAYKEKTVETKNPLKYT
ncbi:hypothetical protein IBT49_25420 [Erwinia sp. S63]|uniref:hypothetical protein n=1 Tax=Erwiniaceae TaxID=1903409 RepID=UPI00190B0A2D|nr:MULTISPECIES: hypothetical protein [Erwiniaceae]MBK0093597.1 hypothetical protein [Erwinia sp. S59]MBK0099345.1 hypothetical protein [Erwinia sp. S63]MBK0127335.1 hypothetical protein [Pantoea sp. S61]